MIDSEEQPIVNTLATTRIESIPTVFVPTVFVLFKTSVVFGKDKERWIHPMIATNMSTDYGNDYIRRDWQLLGRLIPHHQLRIKRTNTSTIDDGDYYVVSWRQRIRCPLTATSAIISSVTTSLYP